MSMAAAREHSKNVKKEQERQDDILRRMGEPGADRAALHAEFLDSVAAVQLELDALVRLVGLDPNDIPPWPGPHKTKPEA